MRAALSLWNGEGDGVEEQRSVRGCGEKQPSHGLMHEARRRRAWRWARALRRAAR